jgi:pyrroloquinoline-quinone synthase
MSVLAAKIPDPELRIEILRNVWEEHGEGNTSKMHGVTFTELLKRLGEITVVDIEKRSLSPAVRIFNTTLIGACTLDDYLVGVATLGMIERMFCDISNIIAEGIVARGWLTADTMIHYNLHKDLDVKHSQDFFNVLQNSWNESPKNKYLIEQGLRMGAGLFQSKKQRRMVPSGFFKESQ